MGEAVKVEIKGVQGLLNRLSGVTREDVITRSLRLGAFNIARWSKSKRLTGPRPTFLGVVSGRLRGSITPSKVEKLDNHQYVVRVGTNVKYGRVHELGFRGTVGVKAHSRRITKAFGRTIPAQLVNVMAHSRNVDIKKRPFLKPAIEDRRNQEAVLKILLRNINQQLEKKK